jgi:hypothetical protein
MSNTQTQKNDTETERQENLYKPIHIINPYQNCDCTNSRKKQKTDKTKKTPKKNNKIEKHTKKRKKTPKKNKNGPNFRSKD